MTSKNGPTGLDEKIADLVGARLAEIRADPVKGSYDLAHLKEIHRRLFQDLPDMGVEGFAPGEFRPPVEPKGQDWVKERRLESKNINSYPVYSTMDAQDIKRLESVLSSLSVNKLSKLPEDEFKKGMGELYANIDHIHPFNDGNSRTLRAFTSQLAKEAGYEINWQRFDTKYGRDVLYIARDLSVNKIAMESIQDDKSRMYAQLTIDTFGINKDMSMLLPEVIHKVKGQERQNTEPQKKKANPDPER